MTSFRNSPVIIAAVVLAVLAAWFATSFVSLAISVETGRIWASLAGLMFVALLIERATEVFVEPQSDPQSAALKAELASVRQKKAEMLKTVAPTTQADGTVTQTLPAELAALAEKEGSLAGQVAAIDKVTQGRALAVTIPLSLVVAVAGVRTIGGLLPAVAIASAEHSPGLATAGTVQMLYLDFYQYCLLAAVDVLLTAGLLAGGADGIHKVLDRFIKLAANKPT